jgi:hypothetical protein
LNRVIFFICLLLAIVSIFINLQKFNLSFPPDFRQGAYSILLKAENELSSSKIDAAIEDFKIAMMRAYRCGRKGVFERIKIRLATSGHSLIDKDAEGASRLLIAYSLFGRDFDKSATKTEGFILEKTKGKIWKFEYPLIYKDGKRTFWLDSPKTAPLFFYSKLKSDDELYRFAGNISYLRVGKIPLDYYFSFFYGTSIGCLSGMKETKIVVRSNEEESFGFVLGTNNRSKFFTNMKNPWVIKKGENEFKIEQQFDYFVINSVIILSNDLRQKKVNVWLIREYKPL